MHPQKDVYPAAVLLAQAGTQHRAGCQLRESLLYFSCVNGERRCQGCSSCDRAEVQEGGLSNLEKALKDYKVAAQTPAKCITEKFLYEDRQLHFK